VDLALDLLAMDLSNDPDPVRFDGTPPKLEKESVLLASLFDIAGYLVRTVFADTGADDAVFYYINDHLGTPQIITDETGNIVWRGDYQPFGSVNAVVSDLGNNFRFPGQYYDAETGLYYNYFRYYDPNTGRYLRADPIGLAGMDPNLYGYVLNNPINFIDPYGLRDYTILDLPDLLVSPFQANSFKNNMKRLFREESNKSTFLENQKKWDKLAEDYTFSDALIDMYKFDENEALEYYYKKIGIEPEYFWTTPKDSDSPCEN